MSFLASIKVRAVKITPRQIPTTKLKNPPRKIPHAPHYWGVPPPISSHYLKNSEYKGALSVFTCFYESL